MKVRQHEIDEAGQRIFEGALPAGWVSNPKKRDYGKDYDVEVFDGNRQATGVSFIVQLKSVGDPKCRRGGGWSVPVKRERLRYYVDQVSEPVFIVGADVKSGECLYCFVQEAFNGTKRTRLNGHGSIRVPLNPKDRVDDHARLLIAIEAAHAFMRELRPGGLKAAARARFEKLKATYPMARFVVEYVDGREVVRFMPDEPFEFTMRLTGSPSVVRRAEKKLLGDGGVVKGSPKLHLEIEGLPLVEGVEAGELQRIEFTRRRPIEMQIEFTAAGQRASLPSLKAPSRAVHDETASARHWTAAHGVSRAISRRESREPGPRSHGSGIPPSGQVNPFTASHGSIHFLS